MGCSAAPDFICSPASMLTVLEMHMSMGQSFVQGMRVASQVTKALV